MCGTSTLRPEIYSAIRLAEKHERLAQHGYSWRRNRKRLKAKHLAKVQKLRYRAKRLEEKNNEQLV